MSWDVSVFASDAPPPPVAKMRVDWKGAILGPAATVRATISAALPGVDWTKPTWGRFRGNGFSLEFNMGKDDPTDGFMIHVRGGGDAVTCLMQIASRCGWYLLDTSTGEWMHHAEDPEAGWEGFQAFRDSVINGLAKSTKQ
jgi:hypothetical protein